MESRSVAHQKRSENKSRIPCRQQGIGKGADTKEYQYLLLRMTNHETAVQIVNNFNVSQLKQRIIMMNKLKSPNIKWHVTRG